MTHPSPCNCLSLRQATRLVTQLYDEALADVGLRSTQYSVLAALDRRGPSTMQALAKDLVMDRSTIGHNLRPLERDGLVSLAVDPIERRTRRLTLTRAGKKLLDRARPLWHDAQVRFDARLGGSAKELRELMRRVVEVLAPPSSAQA